MKCWNRKNLPACTRVKRCNLVWKFEYACFSYRKRWFFRNGQLRFPVIVLFNLFIWLNSNLWTVKSAMCWALWTYEMGLGELRIDNKNTVKVEVSCIKFVVSIEVKPAWIIEILARGRCEAILGNEFPFWIEQLDTMISGVGTGDLASRVTGNVPGILELSWRRSFWAKFQLENDFFWFITEYLHV